MNEMKHDIDTCLRGKEQLERVLVTAKEEASQALSRVDQLQMDLNSLKSSLNMQTRMMEDVNRANVCSPPPYFFCKRRKLLAVTRQWIDLT